MAVLRLWLQQGIPRFHLIQTKAQSNTGQVNIFHRNMANKYLENNTMDIWLFPGF